MPNSLNNTYDFLSDHTPDGIVLSGGNDINPLLYGKNLISFNMNVSDERDQAETQIIEYAILNELPLLGVCRGAQMINVYFGGSLIQDLTNHKLNKMNHVGTIHTVKFNSYFYSKQFSKKVNSFHNQGIVDDTLAKDLQPLAYSKDKVIEAFKHKRLNILGIQWHPERNVNFSLFDQKLVKNLFS